MTFGMMFGSQQNNMDEWSTDEDPDADYDDDEDDEDDDYLPDEYYDELGNPTGVDKALWEPQVKQYSNMNLKDQVSKAREGDAKQDEVKKQRLAKKRAEKRKKQKEKKQCTTKGQGDDSEFPDQASSSGKKFDEVIPPESLDK